MRIASHLLILILAGTSGELLYAGTPQGKDRELVIKEVLMPLVNAPFKRSWTVSFPLGDVDRNGKSDFIATFSEKSTVPGAHHRLPGLFYLGGNSYRIGPDGSVLKRFNYADGWPHYFTVLLNSAGGIQLVTGDLQFPGECSRWDAATGQFQGHYSFPNPPPGKPPVNYFQHMQWAGDPTLDGFDDFYILTDAHGTQNWGVTILMDGRSGQPVWQHYLPNYSGIGPIFQPGPGPPDDINSDGIPDYLAGFHVSSFFQKDQAVIAFSGADGSILWQNLHPIHSYARRLTLGKDFTRDGIRDVVSVDYPRGNFDGEITAIDGNTGTTLWSISGAFLAQDLPPGSFYGFNNPILVSDRPGMPGEVDILIASPWAPPSSATKFITYAVLDSSNGNYLGRVDPPEFLIPWLPDPTSVPILYSSSFPIGDIDGDGFEETAHSIAVPAYQVPGSNFVPRVLAIMGQRTLYVPDQAAISSTLTAEIDLPSLPSHPFQLVVSSRFNHRPNDWEIQGWHTFLADTPTLQYSLSNPRLSGMTDQNGNAILQIHVPNRPEFIGMKIISRALIFEPNSSEIKTLSTMGITTIF